MFDELPDEIITPLIDFCEFNEVDVPDTFTKSIDLYEFLLRHVTALLAFNRVFDAAIKEKYGALLFFMYNQCKKDTEKLNDRGIDEQVFNFIGYIGNINGQEKRSLILNVKIAGKMIAKEYFGDDILVPWFEYAKSGFAYEKRALVFEGLLTPLDCLLSRLSLLPQQASVQAHPANKHDRLDQVVAFCDALRQLLLQLHPSTGEIYAFELTPKERIYRHGSLFVLSVNTLIENLTHHTKNIKQAIKEIREDLNRYRRMLIENGSEHWEVVAEFLGLENAQARELTDGDVDRAIDYFQVIQTTASAESAPGSLSSSHAKRSKHNPGAAASSDAISSASSVVSSSSYSVALLAQSMQPVLRTTQTAVAAPQSSDESEEIFRACFEYFREKLIALIVESEVCAEEKVAQEIIEVIYAIESSVTIDVALTQFSKILYKYGQLFQDDEKIAKFLVDFDANNLTDEYVRTLIKTITEHGHTHINFQK